MKILMISAIAALSLAGKKCNKGGNTPCYKGKLVVAGICSNYTIQLIDGALDTAKVEANWKDDVTGRSYTNVFALGSPCTFSSTIKEGDEFYFTIDDSKQPCAVCMAYYPKPQKALSIKILDKPCK
jgi:hypothetical protein